ncbi:hypothetical protein TIFTF001_015850 [Ficus carica]|uniref:Uncharacterized protein n=1 Tax=Ficus carica TaxID=3494 RepID=A0AA88A7X8_FICCA|nr:hypothetical protein TIFTF001_015850 [Ficus carica]
MAIRWGEARSRGSGSQGVVAGIWERVAVSQVGEPPGGGGWGVFRRLGAAGGVRVVVVRRRRWGWVVGGSILNL